MEPRSRSNLRARSQKSEIAKGEGPNWMLVASGALLSSLFIHLSYKLKQALEARQPSNPTLKDNGKSADRSRPGTYHSHPIVYTYGPAEDAFCNCNSGTIHMSERKKASNGEIMTEAEASLTLVTFPSPCASDSGSDVYAKREVIQKLRQQLKKRDEMVLEMQDQIAELQNALSSQVSHANNLQPQLDSANRDLFDSETEIQRLRKAIAHQCVTQTQSNHRHTNGYVNLTISDKCKGDGEKMEMLKSEIGELKEVIQGKEFLVQSYKEQKSELSIKMRELQQRLDSQLPNIL